MKIASLFNLIQQESGLSRTTAPLSVQRHLLIQVKPLAGATDFLKGANEGGLSTVT